MAKSRARYLSELLGSDGLVQASLSALAGADGIVDLEVLPTIPNSQLENSTITISGNSISLGGSHSLDTSDLSDVTITSASTDQILKYNGTAWVNADLDAGSITTSTTVEGSDGTSDWSQASESDPWIATKTVSGLLSTDRPIIDLDLSSVAYADIATAQAAWSTIYRVEASADDELKVYATAEPAPSFSILITVVR